jgi:hypothetical protein
LGAARVGERRFAEFRSYKPATLDANFKTVHICDERAQGFVGAIEALQKARMLPIIKARGAKQQVEAAERADEFEERRLSLRDGCGKTYRLRSNFVNSRTDLEA